MTVLPQHKSTPTTRSITIDHEQLLVLLERVKSRDDQVAFEKIYHHYHRWIYSHVLSLVEDQESAKEIVADVFFKFWKMRHDMDRIRNFEAYLFVAAKNLSYDYLRKHSRMHFRSIQENDLRRFPMQPDQLFLLDELRSEIESAVETLPPRCREVFILIREEGMSYKQVARELDISPKTVENQIGIAIKKLVRELKDYLKGR